MVSLLIVTAAAFGRQNPETAAVAPRDVILRGAALELPLHRGDLSQAVQLRRVGHRALMAG